MHTRTRTAPALAATLLAVAGLAHSGDSRADELETLRAEVRELQQRLDNMAKILAAATQNAPAATTASASPQNTPAASPQNVPTASALHSTASGMDITLGGYIQLNAIRDAGPNVAAAGDRDFFFAPDIPLPGSPDAGKKGKTFLSARTSRLFVLAQKPSDYGTVKAYIEADFFTNEGSEDQANSARFRLRHAYGAVGNLMFGQYWSTFVDADSLPDVMDFGGPTGQVFVRQPQIRYTMQLTDSQSLALAVENPNNSSITNQNTTMPDFIARYGLAGSWGHTYLAGVVRKINSDDGYGGKVSQTTGALSLAGSINLWAGDSVVFQLNGGQGLGRYLSDAGGETAVLTGNRILFQSARAGYVGYQHPWNSAFRSALVVGRTWFNNDSLRHDADYKPADTNRRLSTVHANLIWTPIKAVDLGLEFIWGKREVDSGEAATARRLMAAMISRF